LIIFRKPLSSLIVKVMKLNVEAGKFKLETVIQEHVSSDVLAELIRNRDQFKFTAENKRVTIVYCDIEGFTGLSEQLDPEIVAALIHQYFTAMTNIVFELGGTLDRSTRQTLTAFWGAPISYEYSAERACTAALRMNKAMATVDAAMKEYCL